MIAASDRLPAYSSVPEPTLLFAGGKLDKHPLRGLVRHGPYSGSIGVPARVRVAAMYPAGFAPKIGGIIQELRSPADPKEATNYYVRYPGFEDAFRVKLEPVLQSLKYILPADLDQLAALRNASGLASEIVRGNRPRGFAASRVRRSFAIPSRQLGSLFPATRLRPARLPQSLLRPDECSHSNHHRGSSATKMPRQCHVGLKSCDLHQSQRHSVEAHRP